MSNAISVKIIPAKISDKKLVIDGVEADDIIKLSAAVADSSGYVIFGDGVCLYITNTQPDLQSTIDKISTLCEKMATLCGTSIGAGNTTIDKPFLSLKSEFEQIKNDLDKTELT